MSKEINLDEIILRETDFITKRNEFVYNVNDLRRCMKEACRQTLELAAENAEGDIFEDSDYSNGKVVIDRQSILDTINKIK